MQLVSSFSSRAVNELRAQVANRGQRKTDSRATGTGPAIIVSGIANFGGPIDVGFAYTETTPEIADNFSWSAARTPSRSACSGRVDARHAGSRRQSRNTLSRRSPHTKPRRTGRRRRAMPVSSRHSATRRIHYNSLFAGGFAQDTWKPMRNLTVTYGLRYDVYSPPEADPSAPFAYSQRFRTDKNNFGPRLGVAWGLGKEQKTVIRASSGIFYDPLQTDQYRPRTSSKRPSRSSSRCRHLADTAFRAGIPERVHGTYRRAHLPAQDMTTVSPDFATLYSINANVSISREIAGNSSLSASYLYTAGNRLPVYRNINVVPQGAFLADGRPIFSTTARVYPGFDNILSAESSATRIYSGAELDC